MVNGSDKKQFLIELEKLSRKYKIYIGGCGCCGSPYIEPLEGKALSDEAGYAYDSSLSWISPDRFDWEDEKDKIESKEAL